jgi:cytochrome c oxidase subunit 2
MHNSILVFFLVLAAIFIAIFVYIFLSTKKSEEKLEGMVKPFHKRMWFILILTIVLAIFTSITLPESPYYLFADEQPAEVVHVAAKQFQFIMSPNAIDPEKPVAGGPVELPLNKLVEFRVTSFDVNHGFAIYNSNNELIAQTQAMPGYVNRLRWKFDKPGTYNIFCLEYCGMGHQVMRSSFTVK